MKHKVTFDSPPSPGTINFGVGQPSPDLLPVDLMRTATARFFASARPQDLNYGELQGDRGFRKSLATLLTAEYGVPASPDSLLVTAGNSQALDFVCALFTRPGDVVIVEEPTYFLAFSIFRDHGLETVPVAVDEHGMRIDALESVLERTKPVLLYTIPSFHNPTGRTMSEERRRRLLELSREHDFVVAADEVYQMLWFERQPPTALGALTDHGNVLSLGSFSKILAPALRLGWIQASESQMERLLESGAINSGGSLNHFTSQVVREFIDSGEQAAFLEHLRQAYAARARAMDEALHEHLGGRARWARPAGGYFFWLQFEPGFDATAVRERAADYRTGFQPGRNSSSLGALGNCLRLSFAHYGEHEIRDGVARLARLIGDSGPTR